MTELARTLAAILGPAGWLTGADAAGHARDWLNRWGAPPLGVARPASTKEVSAVIAACAAAGTPVTPQGGNTSLCGAAVGGWPGGVILSLARMQRIGAIDRAAGAIEVEAGVTLGALHAHLSDEGVMFPMHLGAEGTAQIGGLIATNAGGSHAFRYGMMQDLVLGLEVVLADGAVWDGMRPVIKDNAGYQLRRLFCGAEGTLGVVARAHLRLHPAPRLRLTALLACPDAAALLACGTMLREELGEHLTGLEFFCDLGLSLAMRHVAGIAAPTGTRAPWYLLVEVAARNLRAPLQEMMEDALSEALEQGLAVDGAVAASEAQRAALWRLREEQPEGQRLEGPQIKHDLSVPPGRLAEFLADAARTAAGILPGVRVNPFGHLGDGNVHLNLSPPEGAGDFGDRGPALSMALCGLAAAAGGSFAAEHGLGRSKPGLADALRSPVERAAGARIKRALDPEGILNPGVIFGPTLKEYLS